MTTPEHRLLAVFAHPDDETIGAGSLLASAAAAGVDVSVVTCTRGERGEVIPPELAELAGDERALGYYREGELSAALAELAVSRHLFLDQVPGLKQSRPSRFRDSGMVWLRPGVAGPAPDASPYAFTAVDVEVAARLLAVVIRHVRPTAVLTEEPGGGYGHPDHVHAHRVTMRAVELAATAEPPPSPETPDPLDGLPEWHVPSVLWVAQDEAGMRAALRELAAQVTRDGAPEGVDGAALTVPGADIELPGIAVPAHEIGASVDARPVSDRVLAALRAHRTQVQAVEEVPGGEHVMGRLALSNGTLMPLPSRAYLRAAPGYDVGALAAVLTAGADRAQARDAADVEGAAAEVRSGSGHGRAGRAGTGSGDRAELPGRQALVADPPPGGHAGVAGPPVVGAPGLSAGWAEGDIPPPPDYHPAPATSHPAPGGGERPSAPGGGRRASAVAPGAGDHRSAVAPGAGDHRSAVAPGAGDHRFASAPGAADRGSASDSGGWVTVVVSAVVGLIMGMLGTAVHRFALDGWPVGVALALVGVLAAAVAARAIAGGAGLLVAVIAVVGITQAMAFLRPGGDLLVTDEAISYLWLFGAPIACFLAVALPRRWFSDRPRTRPRPSEATQ